MYWQKRFDREDPDAELLQIMRDIREEHKDYGYRRIHGELRKQGIKVNKKRVHRIVQKYGMQEQMKALAALGLLGLKP